MLLWAKIWHLRFKQLNSKILNQLNKTKMALGLATMDQPNKFCEQYMVGKQYKRPFYKQNANKTSKHLELVYIDKCGLISVSSLCKMHLFHYFCQ